MSEAALREIRKRRARKRRLKRVGIVAPTLVIITVLAFMMSLWLRLDDFNKLPSPFPDSGRPTSGAGETFLLLGLDFRTQEQTTGTQATEAEFVRGGQRADTIMLIHVNDAGTAAYGVSIPRDSYVPIPGYGKDKINAAFSYGGPRLMVQTVEKLTDVRIDHVAVIDWPGFRNVTDAVGGVDIYFPERTTIGPIYSFNDGRTLDQGTHRLNGAEALAYVRQRYGLANGDLDRTKRQQNYLRSLFTRAVERSTLANPLKVSSLLTAATENISLDEGLDRRALLELASRLRNLRPQNLTFYNVPIDGFGFAGAASIVLYDFDRAGKLWKAFRNENITVLEQRFRDRSLGVEVQ